MQPRVCKTCGKRDHATRIKGGNTVQVGKLSMVSHRGCPLANGAMRCCVIAHGKRETAVSNGPRRVTRR